MDYRKIYIPENWIVSINSFLDFNGKDITDQEDYRSSYLTSTILGLTHLEKDIIIDLGWFPDGDINGAYNLELVSKDWETNYYTFKSRDIEEIEGILTRLLILTNLEKDLNLIEGKIKGLEVSENFVPVFIPSGFQVVSNKLSHDQDYEDNEVVFEIKEKIKNSKNSRRIEIRFLSSSVYQLSIQHGDIIKVYEKNSTDDIQELMKSLLL